MIRQRIVHITDLHLEEKSDTGLLAAARAQINELRPHVIVCTGDLVMRGDAETMRRNHEIARNFIETLYKDLFVAVPGNHDCYGKGRADMLPLYREFWGEDRCAHNLDGLFIVGLNSAIIDSEVEAVCASAGDLSHSIRYLDQEIRGADKDDFRVFALHHHLIPMYNDTFGNSKNLSMVWNAGEVLRILRNNRFDLVLMGHKHAPEMFVLDDTVHLIGASLTKKLPDHAENAFHVIDIEERISIQLCRIQSGTRKVLHCVPNKRWIPD